MIRHDKLNLRNTYKSGTATAGHRFQQNYLLGLKLKASTRDNAIAKALVLNLLDE